MIKCPNFHHRQDSPQTTLTRSKTLQTTVLQGFSTKLAKSIVSTAITVISPSTIYDEVPAIALKTKSLELLPTDPDTFYERHTRKRVDLDDDPAHIYQCEYHRVPAHYDDYNHYHTYDIYASDSILNAHIDNIYDVPCDEYPASCDSLLAADSTDRIFVFNEARAMDATAAASYRDELQRLQMARANDIHDYECYYRRRGGGGAGKKPTAKPDSATTTEPCSSATSTLASDTIQSTSSMAKAKTSSSSTSTSMTTFHHRKTPSILYSPLHYHANSNLSSGRPNSRNSLNSRLSSSQSLTISSSHKADSTAFITQAMSHDALTTRDISDFYNVPIDSDIYALPIDVIRPIAGDSASGAAEGGGGGGGLGRSLRGALAGAKASAKLADKPKSAAGPVASMPSIDDMKQIANSRTTLLLKNSTKRFRGRLKYVRNTKKRKRHQAHASAEPAGRQPDASGADKRHSVPDGGIEPMRMTLDEVKRFYTNLYSSSSESALELSAITKNMSSGVCAHGGSNSGRLNKLAIGTFSTFAAAKQPANGHVNNNNSINVNNNNNNNTSKPNNNVSDGATLCLDSDRNFNSTVVNGSAGATNSNSNNVSADNGAGVVGAAIASSRASIATNTAATLQQAKAANGRHFKKTATSLVIAKESADAATGAVQAAAAATPAAGPKKSQFSINLNLKQRFCSIFRFRKSYSTQHGANAAASHYGTSDMQMGGEKKMKFLTRALPPLPLSFKG